MNVIKNLFNEYGGKIYIDDPKFATVVNKFYESIMAPSLNVKVKNAVTFRRQGHFDKAMLLISEANRDQVMAIRKIQQVLDEDSGTPAKEVIFAKYKQTFPLEIGIENGGDVLGILEKLSTCEAPNVVVLKTEIHSLEAEQEVEQERLDFLQNRFGDTAGEEIAESQRSLDEMDQALGGHKAKILEAIFKLVDEDLKQDVEGVEATQAFLDLSWNIFFLFMSPIATKHADQVDPDQ